MFKYYIFVKFIFKYCIIFLKETAHWSICYRTFVRELIFTHSRQEFVEETEGHAEWDGYFVLSFARLFTDIAKAFYKKYYSHLLLINIQK